MEETQLRDEPRECTDCKQSFTWTASEQYFYMVKGFPPPKRCPACRAKRRALIGPRILTDNNVRGAAL